MKIYFFLVPFLLLMNDLLGQTWLKTTAAKGDGVLTLLSKYRLDEYDCSLNQFYKINKLKKNTALKAGKSYFVPVETKKLNKKTIKESISCTDTQAEQIESYNRKMYVGGMRDNDYKDSKTLWVPYGILNCEPKFPKVSDERTFAVLGKDDKTVKLKDKKLAGGVYYLIAGHGGPDPGAMGKENKKTLCEDEYSYDVTLRLGKNLMEHGATVVFVVKDPNDGIRGGEHLKPDSDEVTFNNDKMPVNQKARLTQRTDIINDLFPFYKKKGYTYQRVIEIHVDSRSKKERIDLFFYHHSSSVVGWQTANIMHNIMECRYAQCRKTGDYDGSVQARDLHTLRESKVPAVFVELGNIQNKADRRRIMLESNRRLLAEWLCEGLLEDR